MGRNKEYRQKLKYQVSSAKMKTMNNQIRVELKDNLGLSEIESELLAGVIADYLAGQPEIRNPNQLIITGAQSRTSFSRRYVRQQGKRIKVTPFHSEDLELKLEFGISIMQLNRILRLIEEANRQDSLLASRQLSYLLNITPTSLRERLKKLKAIGLKVSTRGLSKRDRQQTGLFRSSWILKQYFSDVNMAKARKEVAVSKEYLRKLLLQFNTTVQKALNGQPVNTPEEKEWVTLINTLPGKELDSFISGFPQKETVDATSSLKKRLAEDFGFSPVKIRATFEFLKELKDKLKNDRGDNQVIYWAAASYEPAGKPLKECQLVPVTISYINSEELPDRENNPDLNRLREIKFKRILRYSTEAKQAGGYLTFADLSYLMGINTESLRKLVNDNSKVVIPLRGRECDIGRGISHKRKIISLYLQMYTETEIVNRTGHSYEAIEEYIKEFASVWMLKKRGLPAAMIRKITGRSMKLISTYLELIKEYSASEYAFRFQHLEQVFSRNEKTQKRGPLKR